VLSGQLGILAAAWSIDPFTDSLPELFGEDEPIFTAICSETDHLPIGRVRDLWHSDFLPEKDVEIARCEELWPDEVLGACERIILRSGSIQ